MRFTKHLFIIGMIAIGAMSVSWAKSPKSHKVIKSFQPCNKSPKIRPNSEFFLCHIDKRYRPKLQFALPETFIAQCAAPSINVWDLVWWGRKEDLLSLRITEKSYPINKGSAIIVVAYTGPLNTQEDAVFDGLFEIDYLGIIDLISKTEGAWGPYPYRLVAAKAEDGTVVHTLILCINKETSEGLSFTLIPGNKRGDLNAKDLAFWNTFVKETKFVKE